VATASNPSTSTIKQNAHTKVKSSDSLVAHHVPKKAKVESCASKSQVSTSSTATASCSSAVYPQNSTDADRMKSNSKILSFASDFYILLQG